MAKTSTLAKPKIKTVLVSQPQPDKDKNPYLKIAEKYQLEISFRHFIQIEPLTAKDFRKSKVDLNIATALIFNSRNAIDHFFRIADEIRFKPFADMKYFCISEAVALYLQKFIQYRKRKVFYGNGTDSSLQELLLKHKFNEHFLHCCSNVSKEYEFLKAKKFKFQRAVVYNTNSANLKDLKIKNFDLLVFFTPAGIQSLFENFPTFQQKKTKIGVFGEAAQVVAKAKGLEVDIPAPTAKAGSMADAIGLYIDQLNKQ